VFFYTALNQVLSHFFTDVVADGPLNFDLCSRQNLISSQEKSEFFCRIFTTGFWGCREWKMAFFGYAIVKI